MPTEKMYGIRLLEVFYFSLLLVVENILFCAILAERVISFSLRDNPKNSGVKTSYGRKWKHFPKHFKYKFLLIN